MSDLPPQLPINFVEEIWHYLSPFSAHQIEIDGTKFPTHEHAYQALRLRPGKERDEVKSAPSPMDAWRVAQKYKSNPDVALDMDKAELGERIMRAKLGQHPDIAKVLIASGDRGLHKVFQTDYFWGIGHDGSGQNMMGKIWMKLRDELR